MSEKSTCKLRVRTIIRRVRVYGYRDLERQRVQQLGYDSLFGFKVVDEEIVPSDIDISLGCFGDIGRGWASKFNPWIPKARGGSMEDFT